MRIEGVRVAREPPPSLRSAQSIKTMIAHLDLDAFFAAVELHRRPELRGRPLVVGGDPHGRGVVATASYAARAFGIKSAMSCAEALRRCPQVVFVRPDMAAYREWSDRLWEVLRELAPAVEQLGMDEGYLALRSPAPEHAYEIQQAVRERVRLSCSLGVASCKVVAKIASDQKKPGGITVVPIGEEAAFLSPLGIRLLPGVGPKTEQRLRSAGVETIGALATLGDDDLAALGGGQMGRELRERARGIDPRPVASVPAERVSISTEETFERDVADLATLRDLITEWAPSLAQSLDRRERLARTVTLKVRLADFRTLTRAQTLDQPTADGATIAGIARRLLDRLTDTNPGPFRLLGIGVTNLVPAGQLSLFVGERRDRIVPVGTESTRLDRRRRGR
jgi:DNA polymerase IV